MSDHALTIIGAITGLVGAIADVTIVMLMLKERAKAPGVARRYWPWIVVLALVTVSSVLPAYFIYKLLNPSEQNVTSGSSHQIVADTSDVLKDQLNTIISDSRLKMPYEILAEPNWPTDVWLTDRRDASFTLRFTSQAPVGAHVDWKAIFLPDEPHRLTAQLTKRDAEFRAAQERGARLNEALKKANGQIGLLTIQLQNKTNNFDAYLKKVRKVVDDIETNDPTRLIISTAQEDDKETHNLSVITDQLNTFQKTFSQKHQQALRQCGADPDCEGFGPPSRLLKKAF